MTSHIDPQSPEARFIEAHGELTSTLMFGKTHRPEEAAKLARAMATMADVRDNHPEAYQRVEDHFNLKIQLVMR